MYFAGVAFEVLTIKTGTKVAVAATDYTDYM